MSLTAIQTATSPNVAYTRLLYTVSGSIYTGQPQFQYVCDVYNRDTNELLKRMTQGVNPGGSATFDVARIVQGELEADYNWKINTATEFSSSKQGFEVKLGEQFGTSISSSVTVYPDQATYQIYCNQGVIEPNAGAYNWQQVVDSNTLSNMPATMSMQSDDYGTISAYVSSGSTVISQSFYSASDASYVKVDEKNYSLVSGFDDYFWAIPISSSANYWNYVDVSLSGSYGLSNYRYEASDETHREKTRFAFVNKLGAWDYYNNYNPVRQAIDVEREQYTAPRVDYSSKFSTYDIERRGRTDYHNSTDDSFTVDTDLLDQENANWLEELIESPEVYIQRNGEFIPIVITDTSYTADTNPSRQKLFKYTINFKPSNQPFGTWIPEYVQCPKDFTGCDFIVNSNTPATGITTSSMTLSAQLTASLGQDVQEIGFVYSTTNTVPTVGNSTKQASPGIVYPVTSSVFDLNTGPAFTCGTTVYYRGYASSSNADCDIVYGPVSNDTTSICTEPILSPTWYYDSNNATAAPSGWNDSLGIGGNFSGSNNPGTDATRIGYSTNESRGTYTGDWWNVDPEESTTPVFFNKVWTNGFNGSAAGLTGSNYTLQSWVYINEFSEVDGSTPRTVFFTLIGDMGPYDAGKVFKVSVGSRQSGSVNVLSVSGDVDTPGANITQLFPNKVIDTGSWYQISLVQDGTNFNDLKVYVNDETASYSPTGSADIRISGSYACTAGTFNNVSVLSGSIANVICYSTSSLTQGQVAENYTNIDNYLSNL